MAKINNRIVQIGRSIRNQSELERSNRGQKTAVARFDVDMVFPNGTRITHLWLASQPYRKLSHAQYDIAGNFRDTIGGHVHDLKEEGSQYFDKNSAVGVLLTQGHFGTHVYRAPVPYTKKTIERTLTFTSRATFSPGKTITNLAIQVQGEPILRFANLKDLLQQVDDIERQLEKKRNEQEERLKREEQLRAEAAAREEALAKAKAEEAERIRKAKEEAEAELYRQEELKRQEEEEIRLLEEKQSIALQLIEQTNTEFRSGYEMRVTYIVDESQTNAKVSHLYDGIPIVIEGGPGTGKTTTSIQRLKFLIDPYLHEHESCKLTSQQIDLVTDSSKVSSHWIFISPSTLLAQYLKSALSAEGLANDISNVTPFENFLIKELQEYYLTISNTEAKAPFRPIKSTNTLSNKPLIPDGHKAVIVFEQYVIKQLSKPFQRALEIKTAGFDWRECAISIQLYCKEINNTQSLLDIVKLFARIQDNEKDNIKQYNDQLKSAIEITANRLRKAIMNDEETVQYLAMMFEEWSNGTSNINDTEDLDLADDEDPIIDVDNIDSKVYQNLKSLIRRLSIQKLDKSIELSKHQKEFYVWVKKYVDDVDLTGIGNLAWFNRNFASLCRGFESGVLSQIVKLYKAFRREQSKSEDSVYDTELLLKIISSSENRYLHHDEQSLILGFINNLLKGIAKWSRSRFNNIKHQYAQSYKRSVKYVIGVDEASDYSVLDYYCIASFAHYDFSSITLCGDIMQGLGVNGIQSWNSLKKWVFPKLDVFTLRKSYRQWPTLLEVSQQMYFDDQKKSAPFESALVKREHEAVPLAYISTNEDKKIDWLIQRIDEVRNRFNKLPSIAIFINDDEDVDAFLSRIRENEKWDKYIVEDCTHGNQGRDDSIRVFHLSTVKGMEFEAAFFHNIDNAKIEDKNLLRRYLYVGISRAVSHLGATFTSDGSDVLKYFELNKNWRNLHKE